MVPQSDSADDFLAVLSPRERDVLAVAARGLTNAQIAADLNVSTYAVKFHLAAVFRKLGVSNRTQAVALYLAAKLPVLHAGESDTRWT